MVENHTNRAHRFGRPDFNYADADDTFGELVSGRLVVITGGGGLLGAALAAELGARGADIVLLGHDESALDEVVGSLDDGVRSLMLRCDVTDETDVAGAVRFIEHMDRPVDVLIHAGGLQGSSTIAWSSVKGLDEHYLWNVRGPYILTQRLLPLLSSRSGRVVFFTAPADSDPTTDDGGDAHHRISLAGMESFARELRVEASRMGIRVLTVNAATRIWTDVSNVAAGPSGETLLGSLASAVSDVLLDETVEVTSVSLRAPSGTSGVQQS